MTQAELFEPTGVEIGPLVLQHMRKAEQYVRSAAVFAARGWDVLARQHASLSREHDQEAECLGMLADFERLGRVRS